MVMQIKNKWILSQRKIFKCYSSRRMELV